VHGDSYVLPLSDPEDIVHARSLITAPAGTLPSIVIAKVAPGADGINRDYRAPGTPPWSWHVTEFESFADFSIEILDGWPSFIEQDVPGWMANTNSTIGFWNYTVVAEISPVPEPASAVLLSLVPALAAARRFRRGRWILGKSAPGSAGGLASPFPFGSLAHLSRR
jgi:hypothetical protein